jgi:copper homeostasis protein
MLEVIVTTLEEALLAEQGGAGRLELVANLAAGGLTPDLGLVQRVIAAVRIPVNVMIRPHARGFHYREEELRTMLEGIRAVRGRGAGGVVLGALDAQRRVHLRHLEILLACAEGLEVTFHRAIDAAADPLAAARTLARVPGIRTILTSGGPGDIVENIPVLRQMRWMAAPIRIMAGGGLTLENTARVLREAGIHDCHCGTAVRKGRVPGGPIDPDVIARLRRLLPGSGMD